MIAATIGLLLLAGWPLAGALDPEARGGRRAGEALLLGSAASVVMLEILAIAGVRWTRVALLLPLAVLSAVVFVFDRKRRPDAAPAPTGSRLWYALDGVTVLLILADLFYASLERPYEWDYFGIWGLRGRLFFAARTIPWPTAAAPQLLWTRPGHPLFAPLLYDVVAIVGGRWSDAKLGLLATAFAAALILIVRGVVAAEHSSRLKRSAVTLAVTPAALSIWIGLAEPFLIAFATAGVLLVRRGLRQPQRSLAAGAVFLGCAMMTKDEGLAFLLATALGIIVVCRRPGRSPVHLWPAVGVALPWLIIRQRAGMDTGLFSGDLASRIQRIEHPSAILHTMVHTIVTNHIFWWAAVATLVLFLREIWRTERFLLIVIAAQFAAYVGQNFLIPWDPQPHILFAWSRLLDQFAAIVAFTAASVLTDSFDRKFATAASDCRRGDVQQPVRKSISTDSARPNGNLA